MPNVAEPKIPYTQAEWLVKAKNPAGLPRTQCKKYTYKDGETLDSIAKTVSKPWKAITGQWLALFNWGTSTLPEINWYHNRHNGCTNEDSKGNYLLKTADPKPFVWVPKLERRVAERFRSPSKQDIGHVALDDESKKHINTIIIPPVYSITLELGDIDALFDPIDPSGSHAPIWERKGVQQRLQVLGYLYAPLTHSKINAIAKAVWAHYIKVHTKGGVTPTPEEIKATLKQEVQSNLLCMIGGGVPTENGKIHEGRLPMQAEWAMIRLPGGYCHTKPYKAGDYDDATYDYELNHNRHKVEDDVLNNNDLMHKIPLVATVHRIKPDGRKEPAEGVSVYFQLVKPDEWPEDAAAAANKKAANDRASAAAAALASNTDPSRVGTLTAEKDEADRAAAAANAAPPPKPSHPLRAPHLRDTEMDYGKKCKASIKRPAGLNDIQWMGAEPKAKLAIAQPLASRDAWITTNVGVALRNNVRNAITNEDASPYVVSNAGPKRFVDDVLAANPAADTEDPQKDNAPFKFGGKRDHPVAGKDVGGTFAPGIFEVDKKRDGLHTKRDDNHADYGNLHAAKKVEPEVETGAGGKQVKKHNHAVRAVTNDKGNAGVIFMPSRCGGDRYKLRAYVGPPTLGFDGEDPGGPVVTTGTMVVWRNIRFYRYFQFPFPAAKADAGTPLKDLYNFDPNNYTYNDWYDYHKFSTGIPRVDLSDAGNGEGLHKSTSYFKSDGVALSTHYRPLDLNFIGLVEQYRRCCCELIVEQETREPKVLDDAEYRAAVAAGRKAAKDSGVVGKEVDWDVLILDVPSPYMFTIRYYDDYNTIINDASYTKAPKPPDLDPLTDVALIADAVGYHAAEGIMTHLSGGGILPGLTIVQSIGPSTWDDSVPGATVCTSGIAVGRRSCFLHYPKAVYEGDFCYSVSANAAHELGHVLVRQHQDPNPGGDADNHELQSTNGTSPTAGASGTCVMGYMGCFGEYCGRCALALRGWKIKSTSTPAGA